MAERNDVREPKHHVLAILLEKIQNDPFPSPTHLDMVEQLLTPETTPVYVQVLLDKVRRDPFPSLDHLTRLLNVV